jgi:hypothetical protein
MSLEEETPKAGKVPLWKKLLAAVASIGIVGAATIVSTGFDIAGFFWPEASQTQGPAPTSSPTVQRSESPTPSPSTTGPTSSPRVSPTSASPTPTGLVPSDALASIEVKSELGFSTYGKAVGENLYQMIGGFGRIQVAYGWSGRRADGTEITSTGCQIVVKVAGPQSIPAERYGKCTNQETSWGRADENSLEITTAGTYEVTVEDENTGVIGTGSFTVLAQ